MLSCFLCGRTAAVIEATTPHKLSPSPKEMKLSNDLKGNRLLRSITKAHHNVSSDAKGGGIKLSAVAKDKTPTSLKHATRCDSARRDNESVCAYPSNASNCHSKKKEAVISTVVVKEGHTEDRSSCTKQEVEPDEYSREDAELLSSSAKICSEVTNDDLMSSMQNVVHKDATVDAGNEFSLCHSRMLEDDAKPQVDADGEITVNAIPEEVEDTSSTTDVNAEKPKVHLHEAHDNLEETNDIVPKLVDMGDKGANFYKHKKPTRLFSYGISDQQRDFLFLCAGLVIQAVGFQLKSIVDVVASLILLGYRVYFFASRIVNSLSHIKERLTEAHTKLLSYVVTQDHRQKLAFLHMEKLETMKPLLIAGAKKMGWGCVTAAYVLALLTSLLFISFVFSYFAVKGTSRQKPIHITKELFFDYTKSQPVASLDLLSLYTYHKSNASKSGKVNPMAKVRYRCTIILTVPESYYNRNLGIFQVTSELLSETGETLSKASKPCMLHFKSNFLHYVKSLWLAIPVIAGITLESQTLSLQLFEWQQHVVSTKRASVLRILLTPRAGRPISIGLPELYKAEIQVNSYWMSTSASVSGIRTLVMWIGLSFLLFGFLSSFCMYKIHQNRKLKHPKI